MTHSLRLAQPAMFITTSATQAKRQGGVKERQAEIRLDKVGDMRSNRRHRLSGMSVGANAAHNSPTRIYGRGY